MRLGVFPPIAWPRGKSEGAIPDLPRESSNLKGTSPHYSSRIEASGRGRSSEGEGQSTTHGFRRCGSFRVS